MTMPVLDPDLLKAFVAVADHRSFTRAAAALHRTQSAISMQIQRLEARLDLALFDRAKARVELTAAGDRLLGYARRLLALNEEAVSRLREQRVEGAVRLGMMDDYGTFVAPALLSRFAANHPLVRVEMETGLTASMPDRLGEAFDIVIAMHREGGFEGEFLRREQAIWAASPTRLEPGNPLALALAPPGCLFRKWAIEALDAAARPWRLAFVSHSVAAVEAIAAQGLAITVVKAGLRPPRLEPLSPREGMPPLPAADIRLHRAPSLSPAAVLLADYLTSAIRDLPEQGLAQI